LLSRLESLVYSAPEFVLSTSEAVVERHNFWVNRSFIVIDTETTGLDFENDRIIQLAVAVFLKGQNVWNFDWLLNTPKASHPEALAVHRHTDEERYRSGVGAKPVFEHCRALLRRMRDNNSPVVAFNAPFDFTFLRAEFKRFKLGELPEVRVIDPLVIDRHYQKNIPVFTKPHMRLASMAARYGVSAPTHNALDDAICTGHVLVGQSLHYSSIRTASPLDLHRRQLGWSEEFAAKVRAFADKKQIQFSIPRWPFGDDEAEGNSSSNNGGNPILCDSVPGRSSS
jgi:DNA polymerase III subunit epsilon